MTETVRPAFAGRELPRLSYGIPFSTAAARHVENGFQASRVYIICSGSLARNTQALQQLKSALGDRVAGQRIGMKSHTLWSEIVEIVTDARAVNADLLITLGAGSLTDGAKIAAYALANDVVTTADLSTLPDGPNKRPDIKPPTIPIISIPTSLSAGEYSDFAGGTEDATHQKHLFQKPIRGPQLIILDPELTATTPDSVWLSTGIRAVDHCVETLCSNKCTPATDALAQKALGQLVPGLLRCKKSKSDLEARLDCQLGSVDAMAATTSGLVELGASHGIGHQLGPLGVGHGETSCILLPAVCKYNASKNANNDRQQRVLEFLTSDPIVSGVLQGRQIDVAKADLGDVLDAIIRELGLPRSLAEVGVGRDKLDGLAVNSLKDHWCVTNPVPLKEKGQVLEILEMVVGA
ncbi:Fe-containing alcohol dehydrogenase, putative [Paecilomyces variotii No. 5]|uniref:Fe-containing alcohol dehydrogenase, putative, partial n=1 Tax=Byssochlamys spectabilis (strain No. 5 / NBRC 109023) TaxID=1356009 RepID=V5I1X6_BYSSN|nr:Fe-containing alcohol dehydrogenase, putative [Paecilomyces variotii No. 5]